MAGAFQYLISGGVEAGKREYALKLAREISHNPILVDVVEAEDDEPRPARPEELGKDWQYLHAPINLVGALKNSDHGVARVVDDLPRWVVNLLFHNRDWQIEIKALCRALQDQHSPVILITEEVGLGVPPESEWARHYSKIVGHCNRVIAAEVDHVEFMVAGYAMRVK